MISRSAGILLHPSSLPGPWAIGDIGPSAHRFLEWLAEAGQGVWQFLPLGPIGAGYSPYAALSSFAGDPLLISPELLVEDRLLAPSDCDVESEAGQDRIDHAAAASQKEGLLRKAWREFCAVETHPLRPGLEAYRNADEQVSWLDDWCLFATIRDREGRRGWWDWPSELRDRQGAALQRARFELAGEIDYQAFTQFLFDRQWKRLRRRSEELGIRMLGDLPIYTALDSADVWSRPDLFDLHDDRRPREVSGVPPDYFSEDGQLWGNPVYRWSVHEEQGYRWWIQRVAANLRLVDDLRIDHFRGFESFWSVPSDHETARNGAWRKGPGISLFDALGEALGDLPLVAEDLGVITDEVRALRDESGLPGMKVMQFGFGELDNEHAPHRYARHTVAYSGTHDNDTIVGWFQGLDRATRRRVLAYSGGRKRRIHWDLIRLLYVSSAAWAIIPVQDVLGLGSEARMNMPGVEGGNWSYRMSSDALRPRLASRLRRLTALAGRQNRPTEEEDRNDLP